MLGWSCLERLLVTPLCKGLDIDLCGLSRWVLRWRVLVVITPKYYSSSPMLLVLQSMSSWLHSFSYGFFLPSSKPLGSLPDADSYRLWMYLWVLLTPSVLLCHRSNLSRKPIFTWLRSEFGYAPLSVDALRWRQSFCLRFVTWYLLQYAVGRMDKTVV